ncbi:MAG: hypothetical protein LBL07_02375 [Tannerella sp.]|nr:hypothetical protein [Tannerella sp.]
MKKKMMKRIMIIFVLLPVTFYVTAQRQTEYNRQGDEAMERLDYSAAKVWYEEGISNCDPYSINQLTSIWLADESMRISMRNVMRRCLDCLTNRATEFKDSISMNKLILYYTEGIGTYKNEAKVNFWESQIALLQNTSIVNGRTSKTPREKVKMKFFAGYSASYYAPYGLTVGGVGRTVGWYLRFRTNLSFQDFSETCNSDGSIEGGLPGSLPNWTKQDPDKINFLMATGGLMVKVAPSFFISAGAGYCKREAIYKVEKISIDEGRSEGFIWAKYNDKKSSFDGVALDLDGTFRMGKVLYGSLGCSLLNFENISANAGIGVFF